MSYCIKPGYVERQAPPEYAYDGETDGGFQPHVYDLARFIARTRHARRIVDIGCGAGKKLGEMSREFEIIGVDIGVNLQLARLWHPEGVWLEVDLEKLSPLDVPIAYGDVIICADVIEHLVKPDALVAAFRTWLARAAAIVLSTPERVLCYGKAHNGPPPNPAHVREWTRIELLEYLKQNGLRVAFSGFTQTHIDHPETGEHQGCQTIVVILD